MPQVSRRTIVAAGVAGTAVLAAQAAPAFGWSSRPGTTASAKAASAKAGTVPGRSVFAAALGETFQAAVGGSPATLRLEAIDDLVPESEPGTENRFSLLFSAALPTTGEGIYILRRPGTPTATLFLTPVGSPEGTRTLQAIINRLA
ncbi:DUF6916 family protein [Leifsonia poae]|uniref:DUF6916 family protein n=1 Tax=Leifsonia poae TaxID=110933 RepID=UPI001CBE7C0B|nr:hypothetical protein [Leifsonia poae]